MTISDIDIDHLLHGVDQAVLFHKNRFLYDVYTFSIEIHVALLLRCHGYH